MNSLFRFDALRAIARVFLAVFFLSCTLFSQTPFNSPAERIRFGDHLFCREDFLRASEEYLRCGDADSVNARLVLCYQEMDDLISADSCFAKIKDARLKDQLRVQRFLTNARAGRYSRITEDIERQEFNTAETAQKLSVLNLFAKYMLAMPVGGTELSSLGLRETAVDSIRSYLRLRNAPPVKNPALAAGLSLLVPGLGKIYTGETGDGITAFILTALLGYATYENVTHDHQTRAALTGLAGAFFYSGSVYGSYVSARVKNDEARAYVTAGFSSFFARNGYFLPEQEIISCRK